MNHLGDTNKMVDDKTLIEWNADVGTRFLTIYPDGSFHINQNTPPLYALGELAKAFIKQQDRIKRLEEALERLFNLPNDCCCQLSNSSLDAWNNAHEALKAMEAKP